MSLVIIKIVGSVVMAISGFYIAKNLLNSKEKLLNINNLISLVLIAIPICTLYEKKYSLLLVLFIYLAAIIAFKRIFKISIEISILISSVFMLFTAGIDMIVSSLELSLFTYEEMRLSPIVSITNNIIIGVFSVYITNLRHFKEHFQRFCKVVDEDERLSKIIFTISTVFIMGILYYNITKFLISSLLIILFLYRTTS